MRFFRCKGTKVKVIQCINSLAARHEDLLERERISPPVDGCERWVSLPGSVIPGHSFHTRLNGSQGRSRRSGGERIIFSCWESNLGHPTRIPSLSGIHDTNNWYAKCTCHSLYHQRPTMVYWPDRRDKWFRYQDKGATSWPTANTDRTCVDMRRSLHWRDRLLASENGPI
jgi:hypothetical protein